MDEEPDFEFQLGPNRILKGRGWRGLLALGVICLTVTGGGSWVITPIWKATVDYFHK